jgi:hypothetical protein
MTPASSDSLRVWIISPALIQMKPPGNAKALMAVSFTAKSWKWGAPSGVCVASLEASAFRYSVTSASSRIPFWSRICWITIAPNWYSSEPDSIAEAGLPISGSSGGFGRVMGSSAAATVVNVVRAARTQSSRGRIIRALTVQPRSEFPWVPSHDV